MFPIRWNEIFRKKDGTLGTMEDAGGGGSDLPEYDSGDAGKVLGVDDEGLLEWKTLPAGTKIYYKDYSPNFGTDEALAKFSDGAASASSYHMAKPEFSSSSVGINGYTPISVLAHDVISGHAVGILLKYYTYGGLPVYYLSLAIADTAISNNSVRARVFYVKNDVIERLT